MVATLPPPGGGTGGGATWTLVCFGPFAIDAGAGPELPALGRKARAALAWLAVNDISVARERLLGLLWSRRGEEQARQSLRQVLTEIRRFAQARGVAPPIDADREHVFLPHGLVTTDIARLRGYAAAGDLDALAALLGDCPLPLLDDLDGIDPAFDDWLARERPRQHDARMDHALAAAQRVQAAGRHAAAMPLLTLLRGHDACHQGVAHAAMEAAYAAADRDALRHIVRQHEAALRRELDCGLAPETQALFDRLMRAEWGAVPIAVPVRDEDIGPAGSTGIWIR